MLALLFACLLTWARATQADGNCPSAQSQRIHIGAQTFNVEVAASPKERERGLSGHSALAVESGMWFVFPSADWHAFWMQGMNFPIDLVWVSPAHRVLSAITLHPCEAGLCRIHTPPSPVAYVLEINAGAFAGRAGDAVTWSCAP